MACPCSVGDENDDGSRVEGTLCREEGDAEGACD